MRLSFYVALFLGFSAFAQTDTVTIVAYNLLNFPNGRNDCGSNTVVPNRADTLRKILQYVKPDIFVACEIQTEAGADSVLTRSLNVFGANNYAAATYDLQNTNANLNNQLYYNTDKLTLHAQYVIQTSPRNIDHYVLYVNDPTLDQFFDTTFVEVYMCHLKAGSGSADQATRAAQTAILRDYIATRPPDRNHFVCGDLNVYRSSEACYQNLVSGINGLRDPINMPGNWTSNSSFAAIHTQSTRNGQNLDCGASGGLDDRFDQILVSQGVMSGSDSLKYLPGSYEAIGNDGNHYNTNLLAAPLNTQYPDSIVRALYYMSDHLPVALKAVVTYPTSNGLALYPSATPVSCPNGSNGTATVTPNDGQAPFSFLWDAAAQNQTTATVTDLAVGYYCVEVTDALGEVDDVCVYVSGPAAFSYSVFRQPDNGSCTGEAHVLFSGGTAPYTFTWNDAEAQSGQSAYGLCSGSYVLLVEDANGCTQSINVTIDGLASNLNLDANEINCFPNPSEGLLVIEFPLNLELKELHLKSAEGKRFDVKEITQSNTRMELDLHHFQPGIYFIEIVTGHGRITKKFVKI
jgi:hypothetical protein